MGHELVLECGEFGYVMRNEDEVINVDKNKAA
jgi:hypothetical protein